MDILEIFCAYGDVYIHIFKYYLSRPDICKNKNKRWDRVMLWSEWELPWTSEESGSEYSCQRKHQSTQQTTLYPPRSMQASEKAHSQFFFKFLSPPLLLPRVSDTLKRSKKSHSFRKTHCGEACNIKQPHGHNRKKIKNEMHTHAETRKEPEKQYSKLFQPLWHGRHT